MTTGSESPKNSLEMVAMLAEAWPGICDGLAPVQLRAVREACAPLLSDGWVTADYIAGLVIGAAMTAKELMDRRTEATQSPVGAIMAGLTPNEEDPVVTNLMAAYLSVELLEGRVPPRA